MISKPFIAASFGILSLLVMSGAACAAPSSSSLAPGPNYYATTHQGAQPQLYFSAQAAAKAQSHHKAVRPHRPSHE